MAVFLQAAKGKVALLVLHENCTAGFSRSNVKACCAGNVLFRLNGVALVLTNRCCTHHNLSCRTEDREEKQPVTAARMAAHRCALLPPFTPGAQHHRAGCKGVSQ